MNSFRITIESKSQVFLNDLEMDASVLTTSIQSTKEKLIKEKQTFESALVDDFIAYIIENNLKQ